MDARDTCLWTAWVEALGTGSFVIRASRFSDGAWLEPDSVASEAVDPYFVETAVDACLRPWVVWNNSWSRRQGDSWTTPALINEDTAGWSGPGLAAGADSGVWAIWNRLDQPGESLSIYSSYCAADSWTPPVLVSTFPWWFVPYLEGITAPPRGKVRAVWTGAPPSGIGLYSATWSGDSWEDREFVPGSWLGYYPSICSDSAGGTWLTWLDESGWDTVRYAHHDGTGWVDTGALAVGDGSGTVHTHRGTLCCDARGWILAMWTSSAMAGDSSAICVRFFDGDSWSSPSIVATCLLATSLRTTVARGMVWATWTEGESGLLYYSHTLPASVNEQGWRPAAPRGLPTIVRPEQMAGLLAQREGPQTLLDATGREVGRPEHGCSPTTLPPGVYFIRDTGGGALGNRKVLVVR